MRRYLTSENVDNSGRPLRLLHTSLQSTFASGFVDILRYIALRSCAWMSVPNNALIESQNWSNLRFSESKVDNWVLNRPWTYKFLIRFMLITRVNLNLRVSVGNFLLLGAPIRQPGFSRGWVFAWRANYSSLMYLAFTPLCELILRRGRSTIGHKCPGQDAPSYHLCARTNLPRLLKKETKIISLFLSSFAYVFMAESGACTGNVCLQT